jgi:hypothetical protein
MLHNIMCVSERDLLMHYGFIVFNSTFNNIPVISWRSVLLVEQNAVTRRKPPTCHKSHKLYYIMYRLSGIGVHNIGRCKYNYYKITTKTDLECIKNKWTINNIYPLMWTHPFWHLWAFGFLLCTSVQQKIHNRFWGPAKEHSYQVW